MAKSAYTGSKKYLKQNDYIVGDKQIAQAFSIKCATICKGNGLVCLLMPSKGLLFNRWPKSCAYRKRFFEENAVSVIINFSIYRKVLFDNATAPCTAIIYRPKKILRIIQQLRTAHQSLNIRYKIPKSFLSIQQIYVQFRQT